jgi:multicomponent Na+:H+ antiporter subunit G
MSEFSFHELLVGLALIIGALVMLMASLGLTRFGDVYLRIHAATKSGTLGIGFIMMGVALFFSDALITVKLISLLVIYFFTAPIGAQVLANGAHRARVKRVKEMWVDDLARDRGEPFTRPDDDG